MYNENGDIMDIDSLSIQEKVAQKLIFGINSSNINIIIELIKKYKIGGVILYKKNYSNYLEMLEVIKRLKEANKNNKIPLFISVDQEGGRVNRFPIDFHLIRNNYDMSKENVDLIYKNGNITGMILNQMGINMNFAPVVDINENDSKVLYKRCFYGDSDNVVKCSEQYINAMKKNGVISVIKHFPGHGATNVDSHLLPPYVYDYKKILDKHIKPFEELIKKDADALMVGHLVIRGLTGGMPASISSKFINNYIRDRYKYDGLIITDEINMLSKSVIYNFNLVKRSMFSYGDIVLIKINDKYDNFIEKSVKYINNNPMYLEMLDNSVRRIINVKKKYNINDKYDNLGLDIDYINKEIDKLNEF